MVHAYIINMVYTLGFPKMKIGHTESLSEFILMLVLVRQVKNTPV